MGRGIGGRKGRKRGRRGGGKESSKQDTADKSEVDDTDK